MTTILATRELGVRFGGHVAVDAVSAAFAEGELTAIVGPNGAGKTTYFNLISGQVPASGGRIYLRGREITGLGVAARTRRGIGRAFQLTNLFPGLSVAQNVRLAVQARLRRGHRLLRLAAADQLVTRQAATVLEKVRLSHRAAAEVTALSHGDQRKLEVALLMALEPSVYMFDEPTAGMSADDAPAVLNLIAGLKRQAGRTILLVEHKLDVIAELADRVVVLHEGRLLADGAPAAVMRSDVVREAYLGRVREDV